MNHAATMTQKRVIFRLCASLVVMYDWCMSARSGLCRMHRCSPIALQSGTSLCYVAQPMRRHSPLVAKIA
jgi:hypothetical protein